MGGIEEEKWKGEDSIEGLCLQNRFAIWYQTWAEHLDTAKKQTIQSTRSTHGN